MKSFFSKIPFHIYLAVFFTVALVYHMDFYRSDAGGPPIKRPVLTTTVDVASPPLNQTALTAMQHDEKTFATASKANGNFLTANFVNHQGRIYLCADRLVPCKGSPVDPGSRWVPMSDAFFAWYYDTPSVGYIDYQIGSGNLFFSGKARSELPSTNTPYLSVNLLFNTPPEL